MNNPIDILDPSDKQFDKEHNAQAFMVTEEELCMLVKFWKKEHLDHAFFQFRYAQYGSDWRRREALAEYRVWRISKVLGNEKTAEAIDEAYKEFSESVDAEEWRIFRHGSPVERTTLQERVQEEMNRWEERSGDH